jgi:hypothetical protein
MELTINSFVVDFVSLPDFYLIFHYLPFLKG